MGRLLYAATLAAALLGGCKDPEPWPVYPVTCYAHGRTAISCNNRVQVFRGDLIEATRYRSDDVLIMRMRGHWTYLYSTPADVYEAIREAEEARP